FRRSTSRSSRSMVPFPPERSPTMPRSRRRPDSASRRALTHALPAGRACGWQGSGAGPAAGAEGMLASLGQPPGDVASRGVCPGKSGCFAVPEEVMYWLYLATLVFLLIASYAHHRTSADAGMQPVPGTVESTAYRWFGGGLATLGILALLGWGFAAYAWWVPLVSLAVASLVAGLVYAVLPLGVTLVLVAFPLAVGSGIAMVLTL